MSSSTFTRAERLKSRKIIGKLFSHGQSFGAYPLRVVFAETENNTDEALVQVTFSVPKKRFKKAVERNKIKRKIREAYRLKKHKLYRKLEGREQQLALMFIYTGKELFDYAEIEKAVGKVIWRLGKILNET